MSEHKLPLPIIVRSPGRGGEREIDHPDQPADFLDDQGHVCRPSDWRLTAKGWQRVYDRVLSTVPVIGRLAAPAVAVWQVPRRPGIPLLQAARATSGNRLISQAEGWSCPSPPWDSV
jgi:hypothetical protein